MPTPKQVEYHYKEKCLVLDAPVSNLYTLEGADGDTILEGTPIARTADGKIVKWNPAGNDGSEKAVRLLAETVIIPVGGKVQAVIYVSGEFNRKAVEFGDATEVQQLDAEWTLSESGLVLL